MPSPWSYRGQTLALIVLLLAGPAFADPRAELKQSGCAAIAAEVDAAAPAGPVFIASYPTEAATGIPALRQAAFVYDNALAVMALLACNDQARARRIGDALRIAATHDRFWRDGRMRNAYRAGPVAEGAPPALPGWWDAQAKGGAGQWDEDGYQVGTATGNVGWAALALLALDRARHDPAALAAAGSLMLWVAHAVANPAGGYAGGFFGEEPAPTVLRWVSTEHNVDCSAAFGWLARALPDPAFKAGEARAAAFVGSMWAADEGRFWLGTGPDGHSINHHGSGIDAQLWPLIGLPDAPRDWLRAKDFVRAHHAIGGGYGFSDQPDGIWTEGTAQAALILPDPALFAVLQHQRAPDGLLYAAEHPHISTGLALTPTSTTDDFYYFHLPHLGATAWAVLAAAGANPFGPP